jgi:hypothetical protein
METTPLRMNPSNGREEGREGGREGVWRGNRGVDAANGWLAACEDEEGGNASKGRTVVEGREGEEEEMHVC